MEYSLDYSLIINRRLLETTYICKIFDNSSLLCILNCSRLINCGAIIVYLVGHCTKNRQKTGDGLC
jgi:hypothetical protein